MSKKLLNNASKFIEMSLDMFCIANDEGYITEVSENWEEVLGWTLEELTSKPFIEFVHPDDRDETMNVFTSIYIGKKVDRFVNRYICKNGNLKYLNWRALKDPNSNLCYALATDVTDEETNKYFLEASQNLAKIGHWTVDIQTNTCHWSQVTYDIHEVDPSVKINVEKGINYYIPEHRSIIQKAVNTAIEKGTSWDKELQIITATGKKKWIRAIGRPITFGDNIIGLEGVFQDISNQKYYEAKIEEALERVEERERTLKEAQIIAKIGSWQLDIRANSMHWSDTMFTLFDKEKSLYEPTYEEFVNCIHEEDRERWESVLKKCLTDGLPYQIQLRISYKNEENTWIEAQGRGIKNNIDEVIYLSGTCQDISEKKSKNDELQIERTKVIQASKLSMLGEMAGGIAHEVNNPLTIISGQIYRLTRMINNEDKVDSAKISELSNKMFTAVNRVKKVVSGLLNFAREGSIQDIQILDIESLFDTSLSFCKTRFLNYGIYIDLKTEEDFSIECNDVQISQVFLNILNNSFNALMALPKDSGLDKRITITAKHEANYAVIDFIDNGIGIDNDIGDKVYEPFFTTLKVGEGTGLGLSVAKGIIEAHGGEIILLNYREPTIFRIKLPLRGNSAQAA